jgi:hypothetical protein
LSVELCLLCRSEYYPANIAVLCRFVWYILLDTVWCVLEYVLYMKRVVPSPFGKDVITFMLRTQPNTLTCFFRVQNPLPNELLLFSLLESK